MNSVARYGTGALLVVLAAGSGCRDAVVRPLETDPPQVLESWGGFGSNAGQFHQPIGVARGPDGSIYVADTQHDRIQKFTSDGAFLDVIGEGFMHFPSAIAVGPDNRIYVGDHSVRVHVFNADGSYLGFLNYYAGDAGLAMSTDGNLLVAGYKVLYRTPNLVAVGPRVWRVSPDGEEVASFKGPDDGLVSAWFPQGITEDQNGRIYVTGTRQHREGKDAVKTGEYVWEFDRRGTLIQRFGIAHDPTRPLGFEGVAVDSRGAVYVAEWRDGAVYKFSPDGNLLLRWRSTGGNLPSLNAPVGLLVDPSDRLYVTDWSQNLVYKFGYN